MAAGVTTSSDKTDAKLPVNPGNQAGKLEAKKLHNVRSFSDADKAAGCDWKAGVKWAAVAIAILGVFAAIVGALVFFGQLQLGLTGVGAMSAATSLYVMLAGIGTTVITGILLAVTCVLSRAKDAKEGDKKPWTSCSNLCGGDKAKNPGKPDPMKAV